MKRTGFTMLEMVVALLIIMLIVTLTIPQAASGYRNWQQKQFWRELKQEWQFAQSRAQTMELPTNIMYDQHHRELCFISNNHNRALKVPPTIRVENITETQIHANGYVKPATWYFHDQLNHQNISLKIQMAGGGYRIEKKRLYYR